MLTNSKWFNGEEWMEQKIEGASAPHQHQLNKKHQFQFEQCLVGWRTLWAWKIRATNPSDLNLRRHALQRETLHFAMEDTGYLLCKQYQQNVTGSQWYYLRFGESRHLNSKSPQAWSKLWEKPDWTSWTKKTTRK